MSDKLRVLVQDDEDMFRSPATVLLRMLGFHVDQSSHGVEGLDLVRKGGYAAIFTDVEMPNMNGFEFLGRVKRDPTLARTPVIICTTLSKPEHIQKAKELGAQGYIVKPMTKENLQSALKHLKLIG